LTQSLASELPCDSSHELLIDYFEEIRFKFLKSKQGGQTLGRNGQIQKRLLKDEEAFYHFILCLFRVEGILFTRIGVDELDGLFTMFSRQLGDYVERVEQETNISSEALKMQHVSLILIFMVHATISEATKELKDIISDEKELLLQVFRAQLPTFALKQLSEFMLMLLDRILSVPNEWIKVVSPIIIWMTLHTNDKLVDTIFDQTPILK